MQRFLNDKLMYGKKNLFSNRGFDANNISNIFNNNGVPNNNINQNYWPNPIIQNSSNFNRSNDGMLSNGYQPSVTETNAPIAPMMMNNYNYDCDNVNSYFPYSKSNLNNMGYNDIGNTFKNVGNQIVL